MWDMSSTVVDDKYRIVIERDVRKKIKIKPKDRVIVEPIDETTFKVSVINSNVNLEEDPAWKALHEPVKARKKISPEKLHRYMEEEIWGI